MLKQWLLIGILAATTYVSRWAGLEWMAGRDVHPVLRKYFHYVPAAVLSGLIMDQILVVQQGGLSISWPILGCCLVVALSMISIKRFLPSLILGLIAGLLLRVFL